MVIIPTSLSFVFVWLPTLVSVGLSFTDWNGIGGLGRAEWVGLENYEQLATTNAAFWDALRNNLLWLVFLVLLPTTFGLLLAVLLDTELRFGRFYQGVIYLPVVLAPALVGFIVQLLFSRDEGFVNGMLGMRGDGAIDWLGNSSLNIWAVLLLSGWRHAGYVMILYLAGLKSIDPQLREAASLDGAGPWQTFRWVVFPALKPINVVVLVVTVIESLRAFDVVYVVNKGTNGLELLSVLVTQNIVGEASRIGYGSAIGTILLLISSIFIVVYLSRIFRQEADR